MSRRLTRREMLQKDDFVSGVERLTAWVEDRWRTLLAVVGGVVGTAVLGGLVSIWVVARGADADRMLGEAFGTLQEPLLAAGQLVSPQGTPGFTTAGERDQAALDELNAVREAHPLSRAATLAAYMRGTTLLRLGRPEEAREALLEFTHDNDDPDLTPLARRALSRAELASGNPEEALRILGALADSPTPVFPVDAALMELARAQEESGRLAEAAETYRRLTTEHPESIYSGQASQAFVRLDALGVVPGT